VWSGAVRYCLVQSGAGNSHTDYFIVFLLVYKKKSNETLIVKNYDRSKMKKK